MSTEIAHGNKGWISIALDKYGHHTFGLFVFFSMWFAVIQPQMKQNKIDYEKQLQLAEFNNEQAEALKTTAEILERTVKEIKNLKLTE